MAVMDMVSAQSGHWLRRVNTLLTLFVVLLGLYLIFAPLWPQVVWLLESHPNPPAATAIRPTPIPKDNLLVIPRLNMKEAINSGPSITELRKGVWLIPNTSTPDKASNTVMAGHRFTYTNPRGVFYYLDKIQLKDAIVIDWKSKQYIYRVTAIKVVQPTDVSIQNPTGQSTVTLYTCTPLWSPKERLVVQASLVKERS